LRAVRPGSCMGRRASSITMPQKAPERNVHWRAVAYESITSGKI
jgi:hypothetical protein